jgi:hypothetical protein
MEQRGGEGCGTEIRRGGAEVLCWSVGVMECWGRSFLVIFVLGEINRDCLGLEVLGY